MRLTASVEVDKDCANELGYDDDWMWGDAEVGEAHELTGEEFDKWMGDECDKLMEDDRGKVTGNDIGWAIESSGEEEVLIKGCSKDEFRNEDEGGGGPRTCCIT